MTYQLPDGRRYRDYGSALSAVMDEATGERRMLGRVIRLAEEKMNHDLTISDQEREAWYWTAHMLRRLENDDSFVPNGFRKAHDEIRQTPNPQTGEVAEPTDWRDMK